MTSTVPSQSVFHLALDATSSLLTAHWSEYVPDTELQRHFTDLLITAQRHGKCRFWLLDLRGRAWHTTQVGQWLGTTFAAQAAQALGKPVFIACIFDPTHRIHVSGLEAITSQRACAAHNFYPYFFDNEADAREWLKHQQGLDHIPGGCQAQQ